MMGFFLSLSQAIWQKLCFKPYGFYHVVATDRNGVIGVGNSIPWQCPPDMKYFRQLTTGHVCIVGRKTYESFNKRLNKRMCIVVTRDRNYTVSRGDIKARSVKQAMRMARLFTDDEVYVIGGESIYRQSAKYIDGVYHNILWIGVTDATSRYPLFGSMPTYKTLNHEEIPWSGHHPITAVKLGFIK